MVSAIHNADNGVTGRNDQHGVPYVKPKAVIDYCKKMGGVDLSDEVSKYYTTERKTVKWWKKLFIHILTLLLTNAFILFRQQQHEEGSCILSHQAFLTQVIDQGIDQQCPRCFQTPNLWPSPCSCCPTSTSTVCTHARAHT